VPWKAVKISSEKYSLMIPLRSQGVTAHGRQKPGYAVVMKLLLVHLQLVAAVTECLSE
jgi:hypothetical protein